MTAIGTTRESFPPVENVEDVMYRVQGRELQALLVRCYAVL